MKSVDLPHLRSVVLAGHSGAGKTTLAEQLLFRAGAIPRAGRVDDGTAHLDFEPEEQKRHISLSLGVATFEADGTRITLVDTPGYADFVAEMIEGFEAADGALFVIEASGVVEAGLEKAVELGRSTGTAACFVVNRCDRENADPAATLDALRSTFGTKIAPLQVAIGAGESFAGYVDLVHRKAWKLEWVADVQPVGSGEPALKYLAAYVYRTAFSAEKIVADDGQHVTFSYRDNTGKNCRLKLSAEKFLHRFLQHVLPRGLQRVRHFGWLSAAAKERFARVRALLDWQPPQALPEPAVYVPRCPCCQKPMQLIGRLARPPPWKR